MVHDRGQALPMNALDHVSTDLKRMIGSPQAGAPPWIALSLQRETERASQKMLYF